MYFTSECYSNQELSDNYTYSLTKLYSFEFDWYFQFSYNIIMLPRNKKLNQRAIELRKNMTPQESRLWFNFLRNYPINIYRQRIIGNYTADFYCRKAALIIEIDGPQHSEEDSLEYDDLRTLFFNSLGIKVIRFTNQDIDNNFKRACMAIDEEIKGRSQ